ncbi:MAG: Rab family GTPase [Promethearchaeota archaeon]
MRIQKKISLIGSDGVGKTSIIVRYTRGTFSNSYLVTLGVDFYEHKTTRASKEPGNTGDDELVMQIWDLASQKSFMTMRSQYLSYSHYVIIVVDYNRITPEYIQPWIDDIHQHAGENVPFVLVLNKIDLLSPEDTVAITEKLEIEFGVKIFTTSAKTGENIQDLFEYIAEKLW